jgi:NhaA family Na+:H+ antiporter
MEEKEAMESEAPSKSIIHDLKSPLQVVSKIMQTTAFQHFFTKITQSGFLLFGSVVIAFIWSNVNGEGYYRFWQQDLSFSLGGWTISHSLVHWINDGLMTIFFLSVGLEIKRELLVGGLSDPRRALLPVAAAVGGIIFPAVIYLFFNLGTEGVSGWGIPMATDIVFSLAVLSILGKKVPFGIRLFLMAFAIADDLGAIVVIALFYTPSLNLMALLVAGLITCGLWGLNYFGVRHWLAYILLCILLWFAVTKAGLHPSLAGVITALFIPATGRYDTDLFLEMVSKRLEEMRCQGGSCGKSILVNRSHQNAVQAINLACKEVETTLQQLEHDLSSWVWYLVLPLFALANGGVPLAGLEPIVALTDPITLGIAVGLVVGKPLGIFLFTFGAASILKTELIQEATWTQIFGAGLLGGIGFTMSLFISNLSFTEAAHLECAKIGIMLGSFISAVAGYTLLRWAR